ncbi:MAG: hypothetical protein FWG46_00840 [Treponema sp.]|nr:hypothetical protein [Treponema sp.]
MKKMLFLSMFGICLIISACKAGHCKVTIENNTGTKINRIYVTESETGKEVNKDKIWKNIENDASTTIKLERKKFYDIVLINIDELRFGKKRQAWNEKSANISFYLRDTLDCSVSIENKTGTEITQIIVAELNSGGDEVKTEVLSRSIKNDTATIIRLEKGKLYGIVLINTDERQYTKKRQAWDTEYATLEFRNRDILDRNIWDTVKRLFLWPAFR